MPKQPYSLRREFALRLALGLRHKAIVRVFDIYPAFLPVMDEAYASPCMQGLPPA